MELWDVYNRERVKTKRVMKRGSKFDENSYHIVVHICIFNSYDEMLIQKRQPFKDGWPNMWDITVGGSAIAGETSYQAAKRELYEEIGYKADLSEERPFITINFDKGFDDYYFINEDINIDTLTLQYEEVQKVKWASKEEVLRLLEVGEFIPYYKSLIEILFDMRKCRGAHCK